MGNDSAARASFYEHTLVAIGAAIEQKLDTFDAVDFAMHWRFQIENDRIVDSMTEQGRALYEALGRPGKTREVRVESGQ